MSVRPSVLGVLRADRQTKRRTDWHAK